MARDRMVVAGFQVSPSLGAESRWEPPVLGVGGWGVREAWRRGVGTEKGDIPRDRRLCVPRPYGSVAALDIYLYPPQGDMGPGSQHIALLGGGGSSYLIR